MTQEKVIKKVIKKVITRFAPSPTGYLHIGGARTAIFNYLFAKKMGGNFLLRIEDTDKQRSTQEAIDKLIYGLKWLKLDWDDEIMLQSSRQPRHIEVAKKLIETGDAYYCFSSKEEIEAAREEKIAKRESFIFKSPWRDMDESSYPKGVKPVIRLKVPKGKDIIINDLVQGRIDVKSEHLDDMILLRSDGTPTYMLAVVVDDIDMQITHIIRGDDHLTNASRQVVLYNAIGAEVPIMAHIPMIHGEDGTKLSKRHGALGVDEYEKMGYLSDALFNYLLRLGWSHGDEEIISREQAIEWFDFENVGKSPSRIDFDKLNSINSYYIRHSSNEDLLKIILPKLKEEYSIIKKDEQNVANAIGSIKQRSQVVKDLISLSSIYISSKKIEIPSENFILIDKEIVAKARNIIEKMNEDDFNKQFVESSLKCFAKSEALKIGDIMKSVRICLTGEVSSPSVFEIIAIIGKNETLNRIDAAFT